MKKLLIIALLVILSSLACEKKEDEPRCWTCEKNYYTYYTGLKVDGYPRTNKFVEAVCDFDEEGIRLYEVANSDTIVNVHENYTWTQEIVMKCK